MNVRGKQCVPRSNSDLGPQCLTKRHIKSSRRQKQTTFVVIGADGIIKMTELVTPELFMLNSA